MNDRRWKVYQVNNMAILLIWNSPGTCWWVSSCLSFRNAHSSPPQFQFRSRSSSFSSQYFKYPQSSGPYLFFSGSILFSSPPTHQLASAALQFILCGIQSLRPIIFHADFVTQATSPRTGWFPWAFYPLIKLSQLPHRCSSSGFRDWLPVIFIGERFGARIGTWLALRCAFVSLTGWGREGIRFALLYFSFKSKE